MKKFKSFAWRIALIMVGGVLFAIGLDYFLIPNGITSGGVSGIAMLIVYGVKVDWLTVGRLTILFNLPLFFLGFRHIGRDFFFGSLLGMGFSSICLDLLDLLPLQNLTSDPIIAGVFGGIFLGAGLGLVLTAGASTGGMDISACLLKRRLRNLPIGRIMFFFDCCVAVATGVVYGDINNTLYSLVSLYLSSLVVDKVVYSRDFSKVALIISDKYAEISDQVSKRLDRGITYLRGEGYYTKTEKTVLLCAVKQQQLAELKDLVMTIDPGAFLILQDAHQVLGDGFRPYNRNDL